MSAPKPQILCIDDDESVLSGLRLSLRSVGEVHVASSGYAGLEMAETLPDLAVVICDMRMPGMTGDMVLSQFHKRYPEVTRILLTGFSDTAAAIRAINDGRIFRFLTKPCAREVMVETINDAITQYQLVTAEKQLLEQTVRGCTNALAQALAMASPATHGQATRTCELLSQLARECHIEAGWSMEMAVTLGGMGLVELPQDLQERLLMGARLNESQLARVQQARIRAFDVLKSIPRIDRVLQLLALLEPAIEANYPVSDELKQVLAQQVEAIRYVQRFVQLEAGGEKFAMAMQALAREFPRSNKLAEAMLKIVAVDTEIERKLELPLSSIRSGMVLAQPIYTLNGLLLAPAGYVINDSFPDRLREYCPHLAGQRLAVIVSEKN